MSINEILELFGILLVAGTKMILAPPIALKLGYGVYETTVIVAIGGVLGVIFFYFGGGAVTKYINMLSRSWFGKGKPKRKFTKTNRLIIWVRKKFGIFGIAFITPTIISIILGAIIANHLYGRKKSTLLYLIISTILWSIVICPAWQYILKVTIEKL